MSIHWDPQGHGLNLACPLGEPYTTVCRFGRHMAIRTPDPAILPSRTRMGSHFQHASPKRPTDSAVDLWRITRINFTFKRELNFSKVYKFFWVFWSSVVWSCGPKKPKINYSHRPTITTLRLSQCHADTRLLSL